MAVASASVASLHCSIVKKIIHLWMLCSPIELRSLGLRLGG